MLKIRRPLGRLIFNMGIAIPGKTVFLIETAPWSMWANSLGYLWDANICLLTHSSWVTHICASKLTIIGSDNGLSPDRCQAIIWTNAGILLIGPLGTNFSEILIEILTFSFEKCIWNCRLRNEGHFVLALDFNKMADILLKTFSNALPGIWWSLFLRVILTLCYHWIRYWIAGNRGQTIN